MGTIGKNSVALSENWGAIQFYDYTFAVNGKTVRMDFQDLMVAVSEKRAITVEGEVTPMTTRIRARNAYLDRLGNGLAELTKCEASFESEDEGTRDMRGDWMTNTTGELLQRLGFSCTTYSQESDYPSDPNKRAGFYRAAWRSGASYSANKMTIEGMIQKVKSTIDGLNNEAQTDMSRLQSLVDRRDESYSTATNLMTAVSDTRSNLIRNL